MNTSKVALLDLRGAPGDRPGELAGGVVVVDHANSLVKHAETYLSLMGEDMVTAVVCVAVGESGTEDPLEGVVLTLPPALRHATVLWVGDPRGVDWAPESSRPRPAEAPADALDGLIAALQVPELFDRVVAVAEELSSAAVNPGIRLVSGAADQVELAEARAAAVRSLCAVDQPPSPLLGAAIQRLYLPDHPESAVTAGPVHAARADAFRRLDQVAALSRLLGTARVLFGPRRPTERLGSQVAWAGQAAENYRRYLAELLNRMDGQLQVGHPPVEAVVELGVQHPRAAEGGEIAADLRRAVDARLTEGAPLSVLAQEMRFAAASGAPQGCTAELDELTKRGPLRLDMPLFRRWPLPLSLLPCVFLSCAVLGFLLGPGWAGWLAGELLAVGWFAAGWLLLARRPDLEGEYGFASSAGRAGPAYGVPAVLGPVAGVIAAQQVHLTMPVWLGQLAVVLVVLLGLATVALSWYSAVWRWRRHLQVPELRATLEGLTRITDEATAREWLPMYRRKAIASAAAEVAAGLEEIVRTLADTGNRLFELPHAATNGNGLSRMMRPVPQELYWVVRGDLVGLCRNALSPAWPAAEAAIRTPAGVYSQRLARLLEEYGTQVRRRGLMTTTQFTHDLGPRDALMSRVWSESPSALMALRTTAFGDMTQLCRSGQLGYLSTATEPGLVRFAPLQLRRVLERDGAHQRLAADPGVAWSDGGEFVGALRLMPLRPESVRHVLGGALSG